MPCAHPLGPMMSRTYHAAVVNAKLTSSVSHCKRTNCVYSLCNALTCGVIAACLLSFDSLQVASALIAGSCFPWHHVKPLRVHRRRFVGYLVIFAWTHLPACRGCVCLDTHCERVCAPSTSKHCLHWVACSFIGVLYAHNKALRTSQIKARFSVAESASFAHPPRASLF